MSNVVDELLKSDTQKTRIDQPKVREAVRMLLEAIGEDPDRPALRETPRRVAEMYEEIFSGVSARAEDAIDVFFEEEHDEIILLKDISLYSICEHHLVPFLGKAHVAYIPNGRRITGLSKLVRAVDILCKRPQVQERLTTEIADLLMRTLEPRGAMVMIEAEHLCISMRGIRKPGVTTITSAMRGVFLEDARTRSEAMSLIKGI